LLSDLDGLDWPKGILEMQKNWIGKKEGINIKYNVILGSEATPESSLNNDSGQVLRQAQDIAGMTKKIIDEITCFTTAPVNFGMTFIVISPEHEFVKKILAGKIKNNETNLVEIKKYVKSAAEISEQERLNDNREKTGVFTGFYAYNPVAEWDVPIYIADFVLTHVGTGAVQGCPGHDYKDFEFAKKFNLPIKRVVVGEDGDMTEIKELKQVIVKGMKGKMVNSKFLDGLNFSDGLQKTMDYIEEKGWGKRVSTYHLRDWIFSRQRYWGEPIPMIFCSNCANDGGNVIASGSISLTVNSAKQSQKIATPPDIYRGPRDDIKDLQNEFEEEKIKYHQHMEKYEFQRAFDLIYEFLWHRFADYFIERLKDEVVSGKIEVRQVMEKVYFENLKLLHPFMPFVTEAVWKVFHGENSTILNYKF